jgi:membrane-bound lytic murein transglycosylase D
MAANATLTVGDPLRVPSTSVVLPDKAAHAAELFDRRNENTKLARRGRRPDIHVVRRGDTLASIARRMGTDTRTLARLNDMKVGDTIRAGQKLVVAQAPARPAASAASTRSIAASSSTVGADGKRVTYTVRRGDTLYSVSRILQVTVGELLGWNSLGKSAAIKPGQKLVAFVR